MIKDLSRFLRFKVYKITHWSGDRETGTEGTRDQGTKGPKRRGPGNKERRIAGSQQAWLSADRSFDSSSWDYCAPEAGNYRQTW